MAHIRPICLRGQPTPRHLGRAALGGHDMTSRTLFRRLERVEEVITPETQRRVWQIVIVDSDGRRLSTFASFERLRFTSLECPSES